MYTRARKNIIYRTRDNLKQSFSQRAARRRRDEGVQGVKFLTFYRRRIIFPNALLRRRYDTISTFGILDNILMWKKKKTKHDSFYALNGKVCAFIKYYMRRDAIY